MSRAHFLATPTLHLPHAQIVNGLMMKLDLPSNRDDSITVHYNDYSDGGKVGVPKTMQVDLVIGADGANSRVAKDIDAGEYDYAIAFQVRAGAGAGKQGYRVLGSTVLLFATNDRQRCTLCCLA